MNHIIKPQRSAARVTNHPANLIGLLMNMGGQGGLMTSLKVNLNPIQCPKP
jgi:hypothetical protein